MKWDTWSDTMQPICKQVEQIRRFEEEFKILEGYVQAEIVRMFECPLPCHYKEYHIIGETNHGNPDKLEFGFVYADLEETEAVEEFLYTFESFVSEFGGSLGLFVGFSFYLVLDSTIAFLANCIAKFKPSLASAQTRLAL